MMSLGKEIKKARIDKGYRQPQLCFYAGISQKYLSEIENGHVDPRISVVKRLAHALNVSIDALVREDSDPG